VDIEYTSSPDGSNRLTARIDGEVTGWIEWAPAWDQYAPSEITGLSVIPKFRHQGIATALCPQINAVSVI
jgi:GNAT superfamily N-acetyltransferase